MGALSQLRSPCRILGQYGSLPKVFILWDGALGIQKRQRGKLFSLLPAPSSPSSPLEIEKGLRINFTTLFLEGIILVPSLITVEGISAPIVSIQLKPGVTQYRFSLFLMNYIHIYRGCQEFVTKSIFRSL
jgi:hypothetical protein